MHYEDDGVKAMILRNLRNVRKHMNDDWIPCDERPQKGGRDIWYLVWVIGGRKPFMVLNYHEEYELFGEIENDKFLGDHIRGTAYKWQPLPKPYRPEKGAGE